jgi:two-component system response regulator AlgR
MRILVVDDEPLARERLQRLLARLRPDAAVSEAGDGESALRAVQAAPPDLVLLDIRMPGVDGLAVAEQLAAMAQPPAVVFCTAYDAYALDALRHAAVGYLLKPVREADLAQALAAAGRVNRAQLAALRGDEGRRELVSSGHGGMRTLPVDTVRCLLAEQKYVVAYSPRGSLVLDETLKDLEREFPRRFVRVHRGALVALAHVTSLVRGDGGWVVELDGVDQRPLVSRRHLGAFRERLAAR